MGSRLDHRRRRVTYRRRRSVAPVPRRPDLGLPARGSPPLDDVDPHPSGEPRDEGAGLLVLFSAAVLVMVGLTWLVGLVDQSWILFPVMAVHLSITGAVLALTSHLLNDPGDE